MVTMMMARATRSSFRATRIVVAYKRTWQIRIATVVATVSVLLLVDVGWLVVQSILAEPVASGGVALGEFDTQTVTFNGISIPVIQGE